MNVFTLSSFVFFSVFFIVTSLSYFIYSIIFSENQVVSQRMATFNQMVSVNAWKNDQTLALLKKESDWEKFDFFSEFPPYMNLPLLFQQAGMSINVAKWLYLNIMISISIAAFPWIFTQSLFITLCVALGVFCVSYLHVILRRRSRLKMFESQLAQALEIIVRSLRAGHPFSMGISMVSSELASPINEEFEQVFNEQRMGMHLDESLRRMVQRVPLLDLRFFVLSVTIHSQTGGDLSEILDNLAKVIRERFKILGQVKALTAEGRLSGVVLCMLPVCVFFMILIINPDYIKLLITTELGNKMLYGAIYSQILGMLLIRKIVNIKV